MWQLSYQNNCQRKEHAIHQCHRLKTVTVALLLGYKMAEGNEAQQLNVALAAACVLAFDKGYAYSPTSGSAVKNWLNAFNMALAANNPGETLLGLFVN